MGIFIGTSTKNQQEISIGSKQIGEVYVGDKLVWNKLSPSPIPWRREQSGIPLTPGLDTYNFSLLPLGVCYRPMLGNLIYSYVPGIYKFIVGGNSASPNFNASSFNVRSSANSISTVSTSVNDYTNTGNTVRVVRNYTVSDGTKINGKIIPNAYVDVDGHAYDGVIIGDNVWTTKAINTTKFTDFTLIQEALSDTSSALDFYNDYPRWYYLELGRYVRTYNGYKVTYYSRELLRCHSDRIVNPVNGWRYPDRSDLIALRQVFVGIEGESMAGVHMRSTLTSQN